ncbi:Protein Transport Protein Sec24C [Manis pentadactyla]|nr:Protein Transport Protein Sec24C [Manis pentadactyla]
MRNKAAGQARVLLARPAGGLSAGPAGAGEGRPGRRAPRRLGSCPPGAFGGPAPGAPRHAHLLAGCAAAAPREKFGGPGDEWPR